MPHASAMVCHGGFGTVRAGLAAGVPLAVLPLFADQPYNAERVQALGAGLASAARPGCGACAPCSRTRLRRPSRRRRGRDRALPPVGRPRASCASCRRPGDARSAGALAARRRAATRARWRHLPRYADAWTVATVASRMVHRPTTSGLTRSPFPPIADYGFLSDCETTALVAPDGSVEWLCLPRMDSPSVFGALLDRDAGWFRLGPTGVKVPAGRRYLPGTMVLETSWGTKGGWVVVRDALLIGPWHHQSDRSRTHRRTPTDYDADHVLVRTVRCVNGEVQLGLACEPVFDYGASRVTWEYDGDAYRSAVARAPGSDLELRITTDMNLGIEGPRVTGRHLIKAGEAVYAALSWSEHAAPQDFEEAYERLVWTAHHWQHWLDRGNFPDHPWSADLQRSRAHAQGPDLRADRRDRRRRDDVAARDAGRGAQLGLPLLLDPRLDVRALGPLHARLRLGGQRLLLLRRRRDGGGGGDAADHVRHRRPRGAARADARPPHRLRERAARPRRQRRPLAGPARRLGRGARLALPAHALARLAARARLADALHAGRGGDRELAQARPRHLGGARRAQALHVVQAHVLGGDGPRRQARRAARGLGPRRALAGLRGRDPRRHLRARARRSAASSRSTTTRRRSTRPCC